MENYWTQNIRFARQFAIVQQILDNSKIIFYPNDNIVTTRIL